MALKYAPCPLADARSDGGHQDRVAALARKARLHAEVEDDVARYPIYAGLRAEYLLHRAPVLLQFVLLPVVKPPGLRLEPGVDLVLGSEALVSTARST